jgi:hypothetical protein
MSQIPYQSAGLVKPASGPVIQDPNMFAGEFGALSGFGQTVSRDVAGRLAEWAERKAMAENTAKLAEWDRTLKDTQNQFESDLLPRENEAGEIEFGIPTEKIETAWAERLSQLEKQFVEAELSPAAKQAIEPRLEEFKIMTQAEYRIAKQKLEIGEHRATLLDAAEQDLRESDFEGFKEKILQGEKVGLIDGKDVPRMLREGASRADYYEAAMLIETDPDQAHEMLTDRTEGGSFRHFKNLKESSRKSLAGHARAQKNIKMGESYDAAVLDVVQGNPMTEEEVMAQPWDDGMKTRYIASYVEREPVLTSAEDFAAAMRAVESYDPDQDEDREYFAHLWNDLIGLDKQKLAWLHGRLQRRLAPGNTDSLMQPIRDDIEKQIDRIYAEEDEKALEYMEVKDQMDEFFRTHENPTRAEAMKELQSLTRGARIKKAESVTESRLERAKQIANRHSGTNR